MVFRDIFAVVNEQHNDFNIEGITVHFLDAQANGLEKPQFGLANGKQGVALMQD